MGGAFYVNYVSISVHFPPPHVFKMAESEEEGESDQYSDDDERSHGSTTDGELQEQSYWYSLKSGVLAYAVSLQLHCLLFIVGHVHEFSSTAIGLLPTSIRRKLLLHLPVADILKLECTPVTANISMDDLWQALFNTRMPLVPELTEKEMYILTPEKFEENFKINFNWKEAYFQSFLILMVDHLPYMMIVTVSMIISHLIYFMEYMTSMTHHSKPINALIMTK